MEADHDLIQVAARADAAFAGFDFDALGRADKARYLARAAFIAEAMVESTFLGREQALERMQNRLKEMKRP